MAFSYTLKIPVNLSEADGFEEVQDLMTLTKQNLKMVLLTNAGERVMVPEFGVGLPQFLFEPFSTETYEKIMNKVHQQVALYMPAVEIVNFYIDDSEQDSGRLSLRLVYAVPQLGLQDFIDVFF